MLNNLIVLFFIIPLIAHTLKFWVRGAFEVYFMLCDLMGWKYTTARFEKVTYQTKGYEPHAITYFIDRYGDRHVVKYEGKFDVK